MFSHDVKLCKLLWQSFLWGRTIKHCAITLCLDVQGIGLKMAKKTEIKMYMYQILKRKNIKRWQATVKTD